MSIGVCLFERDLEKDMRKKGREREIFRIEKERERGVVRSFLIC